MGLQHIYLGMKSYYIEVPKLHAREHGPNFNVCLGLGMYAYRFLHEHAVVGSDKTDKKLASMKVSYSHTKQR